MKRNFLSLRQKVVPVGNPSSSTIDPVVAHSHHSGCEEDFLVHSSVPGPGNERWPRVHPAAVECVAVATGSAVLGLRVVVDCAFRMGRDVIAPITLGKGREA